MKLSAFNQGMSPMWLPPKILLIMKLIVVIMLTTLIQVSAASYAQKVSLNEKNASLEAVFKKIRAQTGFDFVYDSRLIDGQKTVNLSFNQVDLEDALRAVLKNYSLSFEIKDKVVVLSKNAPSFLENLIAKFKAIDARGKVLDEKGEPLVGATVAVKGKNRSVKTDQNGAFFLENVGESDKLVISFIGYQNREVAAASDMGSLTMVVADAELEEVAVISTGYQTIERAKATGSYTVVDNKLFNRAITPDLIGRLKGVTNGLLIDSRNNGRGNDAGLSVRGRSTIFSDTKPLIVLDNFPFEGDINSINPNDVENVTLLKDAAAAAIWGVRAGNGVIVITTKKGKFNQKTEINANVNITVGEKPDLYYQPRTSTSDFIDIEKFLFSQGYYDAVLSNSYQMISPVIQLLSERTAANSVETDAQIESLKNFDSRDQIDQYLNQGIFQQQYHVGINGGGLNNLYNVSAGFDRGLSNDVGNSNKRYSMKANTSYDFLDNKLKLNTDLNFSRSTKNNGMSEPYFQSLFPYEQIADVNGIPLAVLKSGGLRATYTDTVGNGKLLDWKYKPLEELQSKSNNTETEMTDIRLNTGFTYKIMSWLTASINYQYVKSIGTSETLNDQTSFSTRNVINTYTQIDPASGMISYPLPLGAQFNKININSTSNYARGQLSYQKIIDEKHSIDAIGGYEVRSEKESFNSTNLFGYNPETGANIVPINNVYYMNYFGTGVRIFNANPSEISKTINNNLSYYANASYSFRDRYVLSGSFRKDESNLFGVKANQKGVPLWSVGAAWNLNHESFFKLDWLSRLQFHASFGYNGNVNKGLSALTTATTLPFTNTYGAPILSLQNPPNPSLRWERVKNINLGLNFMSKGDRISGSIEIFQKNGVDLIGTSPLAQQTGISVFTGNVANTTNNGLDIQLTTLNLKGKFTWYSTGILNVTNNKITKYMANTGNNSSIVTLLSINPLEGYPVNSVFSYKSAGLNNLGNPQGILDGEISEDLSAISNSSNRDNLKFHGSAIPTIFGSLRNTLVYESFELSLNLSYKLGYYFRRDRVFSGNLAGDDLNSYSDYGKRWQKPGDELITNVPATVYPGTDRSVYAYSTHTVDKGDHIRINDIQLSYVISNKMLSKFSLKSLSLNLYANNLGIIWRNNSNELDPEAGRYPMPKSLSIGIKTTF